MPNPNSLLAILPPFSPQMPPIGLGYLQSFLAEKQIRAEILDLNNIFYNLSDSQLKREWRISCNPPFENKIISIIKNNHPKRYRAAIEKMSGFEILGFSCFKSNLSATLEVAKELKDKSKDIRIVLGGPEITRQFFKYGRSIEARIGRWADFLVVGEGEKPLYEYVSGRRKKERIAIFEQLRDLKHLSFPKYEGLDLDQYPKEKSLPIQFCRGCIRRCNFCSERLLYKGLRKREVGSIIEEIGYFKKKYNTDCFIFFDSLINSDLGKLEQLSDAIIANFDCINWEAQIAIRQDMPQRLFAKMKKSGCYNLFVGLESGCDKTLKNMNKGFTAKIAEGFFEKLKIADLCFGVSIIVGFPGESDSDFRQSLDFIIRNKDKITKIEQVNPFTYYDGTPVDKRADYKLNKDSLRRLQIFIREIKKHNFKYTNAFLGNLIEK